MIDDNIRDLCRICVERSEDYIRIYDQVVPDNTPFFHLINDVCQLDISEDDGFPEYVCKECFLKISEFMVFKRMSHEAKLNLLSLTVSLAEVSPHKDVVVQRNNVTAVDNNVSVVDNAAVVDNEAMMATSIIVKQMTADGMTLDVAQPGDIMEEVITMPFVVDYEEVVTADSYTLGNGHVFGEEVTQEEVLLAPLVVDRKRNSKEREVAIILADGGSARVEHQEKAATPVQDTGQVGKQKEAVVTNVEEESEVLKRRSFIAQAYYRSYLQQKKKSEEGTVIGEEGGSWKDGNSLGAELREDDDSQECEDAVAAISEEMEEDPGSPVIMDVSEAEQSAAATAEVVSQESEEVSSNAVCCKKKMLAISKSLELSRGASKAERGVPVGEPTEASRDSEEIGKAEGNSRMSKSEGEALTLDTRSGMKKPVDSNGIKLDVQIKADTSSSVRSNRGVSKGPRFNLSKEDTLVPPKKNRKEQSGREEASNSSQAVIQVIASEELTSKVQQFDLKQQVGDILKTSLSGKKKIQVSEVGPTGNVFHVEPTIVKLKGMPLTGGRNNRIMPYGTRAASRKDRVNVVWEEGGSEKEKKEFGSTNSADKKVEGRGRGRPRRGSSMLGAMEIPREPSTPPAAMGSEAIAILRNRAPKTLLLTTPKEDNTDAQTPLAILLRPLKQEREEVEEPEGAALQQECFVEVKQEVLSDTEESPGAEVLQGDSESFVNRIRLRAKRAMLKCMKRKLDELERMQQGQPLTEDSLLYLSEDAGEEIEVQTTELGEPSEPTDLVEEDTPLYTCVHCGQSSYSKAEMSWHMKQAHETDKQPRRYFCRFCDVFFTKRYMYRLHMEMHELVLDGELEEEDIATTTTAAGEQEDGGGGEATTTAPPPPPTSRGRRPKPFKCRFCNASFKAKAATLYHEACKHGSAPLYPCTNCSRKFLSLERMEDHRQQCCGNRIECEVCHKNYNMSSIVTHMRTHQKEKPYLCAECGKTFSQQGDLKRHTKHFHLGIEPARPFLCSYCPKTFSAQSKLRIHERSHTKEKPYECSECGKGFAHLSSLRKHKENREVACLPVIKHATKPYICSVCKKGWDHKYGLSKHIAWVHERKRPSRTFHCQLCPKVYYCKSQLTYHVRTHTKEKPFVCSVCNKGFMYNCLRKIHMEKDHGIRIGASDAPR
ncbi:uncharacterized protein LOC124166606 [Ischnura elegans]|uniref:uncharacterized protein LOC124166606 n=1 Tax=Ischnura elegans TaxID=197161 RepID=UPI001ED894FE|nr:uncharacterized protein LOC124166606 [Ischnura elegans]